MTLWIIEPRDPLIVRDGRPFGADPGARATSLPFPFPSTIAGGLRHKAGMQPDGTFRSDLAEQVKTVAVRGPLLVALKQDRDDIAEWFAPAPSDALLLGETASDGTPSLHIKQLVPLALPPGAHTSLSDNLAPVGMPKRISNKPSAQAPRFWRWNHFEQWLSAPADQSAPPDLGLQGLTFDTRTHVSIRPQTQTAEEGLLFQTRGLEFAARAHRGHPTHALDTYRLALASFCEQDVFHHFRGGFAPLGGERRLMRWFPLPTTEPLLAPSLVQAIVTARACRIVLLTPACFTEGYRPTWLFQPVSGVTPQLIGAAVPRAQVVSGWDMAADNGRDAQGRLLPKGKPKPTRRLAPAGSVYFVRFGEQDDPLAIERWVSNVWMACISDDAQDRRDGFGLAVCGVGVPNPLPMEV